MLGLVAPIWAVGTGGLVSPSLIGQWKWGLPWWPLDMRGLESPSPMDMETVFATMVAVGHGRAGAGVALPEGHGHDSHPSSVSPRELTI